MKLLVVTLVELIALAACDVSHIANTYLPPNSGLSQSRTVHFSPSTGYSTGNSAAYTSSDFSSKLTSHGSTGYSSNLQVVPLAAQTFKSVSSGSDSTSIRAQSQPLTAAYNSGTGYTSSSKQIVQKTYSAPIVRAQTIQKYSSSSYPFESSDGSASASYTAQTPNFISSFGTAGTKQVVQKTYSAPLIQQHTIHKTISAPSSFESSSGGIASASYTVQSPSHGASTGATYSSGSRHSTGAKQIVQNTYSAPIIQQHTIQKTISAPSSFGLSSGGSASASYTAQSPNVGQSFSTAFSSGSGYTTGGKQIVQKTYSAPLVQQQTIQKSFSSPAAYNTYTAPAQQSYTSREKTSFSSPVEQQTHSTTTISKESYTAPAKTFSNYQSISTPTVQKTIVSAPLIEQHIITSPAAQKTLSAAGKVYNIHQSYATPNLLSNVVSAPLAQISYTAPAVQQTFTSKTVKQSYAAPSVDRSYLSPVAQTASYSAPNSFSEKTTHTSSGTQQSYTAPAKLTTTTVHGYQSVSTPAVQKTAAFTAPSSSQAYTLPSKSYTSYQSVSSPIAPQAYTTTEVRKETYSSPLTQQSYTAPDKSYTSYKSVSGPVAQKTSVVQQSYTAPGNQYSSHQPVVQQSYTPSAIEKATISSAPIIQKTSPYTAPVLQQTFTSSAKAYNSFPSNSAASIQKSYSSSPLVSLQLNTKPITTTSFKTQAVETFSGPSHSSVIAYPGIDTKYASNGGYIY